MGADDVTMTFGGNATMLLRLGPFTLLTDPNFVQAVSDRWSQLRQGVFATGKLIADIDADVSLLSANTGSYPVGTNPTGTPSPVMRNFQKWKILGTYVTTQGMYDPAGSWIQDVNLMKNWLIGRVNWMDSQFIPQPTVTPGGDFSSPVSVTMTPNGPVTTTDTTPGHAGQLVSIDGAPKVITQDTPNALARFQKNINVGTQGSALNKGLDGARLILQLQPDNFLRDDAYLFIIFVSDGDDLSLPGTEKFFYREYSSVKGKGNDGMVLAGGIVGPPERVIARMQELAKLGFDKVIVSRSARGVDPAIAEEGNRFMEREVLPALRAARG